MASTSNNDPNTLHEIFVVGFPEEELAQIPADLSASPITLSNDWPVTDALLVVHSSAVDNYERELSKWAAQHTGHLEPNSSLSDDDMASYSLYQQSKRSLLYVAEGSDTSDVDWSYFGSVIHRGEWERLRQLARCPGLIQTIPVAHQIPPDSLETAVTLLEKAPYAGGALANLPLPDDTLGEIREQLETCKTCRESFTAILRDRRQAMYLIQCPSIGRLGAYLFEPGRRDIWVETHIENCASCSAMASMLREVSKPIPEAATQPSSYPLPDRASLLSVAFQAVSSQVRRLTSRAVLQSKLMPAAVVSIFLTALIQKDGPLQLTPARSGHLGPITGQRSIAELLAPENLQSSASFSVSADDSSALTVEWLAGDAKLRLSNVYDQAADKVSNFSIRLMSGEQTVLSKSSKDGVIEVSESELEKALLDGADEFLLTVEPDPNI